MVSNLTVQEDLEPILGWNVADGGAMANLKLIRPPRPNTRRRTRTRGRIPRPGPPGPPKVPKWDSPRWPHPTGHRQPRPSCSRIKRGRRGHPTYSSAAQNLEFVAEFLLLVKNDPDRDYMAFIFSLVGHFQSVQLCRFCLPKQLLCKLKCWLGKLRRRSSQLLFQIVNNKTACSFYSVTRTRNCGNFMNFTDYLWWLHCTGLFFNVYDFG